MESGECTGHKGLQVDLLVGRDNRKIFPEVLYEGWLKGDNLFLCGIPFSQSQVVCGAAQRDLRWIKELRDPRGCKEAGGRGPGQGHSKDQGAAWKCRY